MTTQSATQATIDLGPVTVIDELADPAQLPKIVLPDGFVGYISPWVADSNSTDHTTTIPHKLGRIPNICQLWFTDSGKLNYLVSWSWTPDGSGNPVTISATADAVYLEIAKGWSLHGVWNPQSKWAHFNQGYWRIVVA